MLAGNVGRRHRPERWYAGAGNHFWTLLHAAGLTPELLGPDDADRLPGFGIGLLDLVLERVERPGREPETVIHLDEFVAALARARPGGVAFVSKTAATWAARGLGEPLPRGYGALPYTVAGAAAFVLPGPSGANNAMSLPMRTAMWRDLVDFLDAIGVTPPG